MNTKLLNLLVQLGHISPAIYDVIPRGPQAAFRTFSPGEAVELNPQPIPPGDQWQLAAARVAHEIALAAAAAETSGDTRAAKRIVARAVDDFCGTPSRHRPIPWPDPWPFPSAGRAPYPRPVPVDTVRLVVALTFASIGSRMAGGAAREALGNGAERLVVTALAGQPRKRVAEPGLSRVLARRAAAGKSESLRREKQAPTRLGRRGARSETPVSTHYREEAVELEDTGVDEVGGTPGDTPSGSDEVAGTPGPIDDDEVAGTPGPIDEQPDAGTPNVDDSPSAGTPGPVDPDPGATVINFGEDEVDPIEPDPKEMEFIKEWQEDGEKLMEQFIQDSLLRHPVDPSDNPAGGIYNAGPPADATDDEARKYWDEKWQEWFDEYRYHLLEREPETEPELWEVDLEI